MALVPQEGIDVRRRVCVVVDVLRATTSILTLLERGCEEVIAAPTVGAARRYAAESGRPVCTAGEEGGLAPAGFDFGNSPAAFARADVAGARVVIATTNGTKALHAARGAPLVLAGCLRNRAAVARAAVDAALANGFDVTIVCSGREGRFSLDDAYAAGAIADAAAAQMGERVPWTATDAVLAARALYRAWPDAATVFRRTAGGRNVIAIGLEEDLRYCAQPDCSEVVPRVGAGLTLLEA